ncbi:hypothetical protein ACJIZ3_007086 [Penstemon smallii]|uniref:Uncharacterized protein n=1 Tax=Penstemon smallii TaxID=265156 RepID=A0ABD3S9I7_9LAMI
MDLEIECSVLESVEENAEQLRNIGQPKVESNGSYVVENNNDNELFSEMKGKGTEVLEEMKPEVSYSPWTTRKGYGLKKWRRIRRDITKGEDGSIDTGKVLSSSKRVQGYTERNQKSEGSASSTNAVVKSLNGFALVGNAMRLSFTDGTDSENSEDRSSKSSTAASAPKLKYEKQVVVGIRTSSGKNSTNSVQGGQQGKVRIENSKKSRGERVKIEKENSHSSLESDSRSSNFVFMQGTCTTSNGIRSERPIDYGDEDVDEIHGTDQQFSSGLRDGYGRDGERGYGNISSEDVIADSSWEAKEERSNNHVSSTDQDPVVESMFALQSAQEALEKELLKLKEMSQGVSVVSISELSQAFTDVEQELPEQLTSGEGAKSTSRSVQSEVVNTGNRDVETELDDAFKRKIEAEVEYLVISKTVQKLRQAAVNQITVLEKQKALSSDQTQILDKLGDTENKAAMLKKEAEKLENISEEIAIADETLKLQKRVCKYTSCFFLQLVLLVLILGFFIFQLSPNYSDVVPT